MIIGFLVVLFALFALTECISYGFYEISINKNKPGGLILIFLSIVGFVFAVTMYFIYKNVPMGTENFGTLLIKNNITI